MTFGKRVADVCLKAIHYNVRAGVAVAGRFRTRVEGEIPKQPCIYVANHFCAADIPTAIRVLKRHFYVLLSATDKHTAGGVMLLFNGLVWIDRTDKADRRRAMNDLAEHLRLGHRVLIYPEGHWNFSPNLPMLPMFSGAVRLSQETGVPIVPAYFLFRDGECRVKIGDAFQPQGDPSAATTDLRDRMATLFYDLLESFPAERRCEIPADEWERNILARCGAYVNAKKDPAAYIASEEAVGFRPKGVTPPADAFAHLRQIEPSRASAFLFDKRLWSPPDGVPPAQFQNH